MFAEKIAPFVELNNGLCLSGVATDDLSCKYEFLNSQILQAPVSRMLCSKYKKLKFNSETTELQNEITISTSCNKVAYFTKVIKELASVCNPKSVYR